MTRYYLSVLRQAFSSLLGSAGRARTAAALLVFLIAAFNQEFASQLARGWRGVSPWYALLFLALFFMFEVARANYDEVRKLQNARKVSELQEPIPAGPPVAMGLRDFENTIAPDLEAYDVIKPRPEDVFKYERRGFERIFLEHRGVLSQVVIGGSVDNPDNIPLRRTKLGSAAKRLLRTAYVRSGRRDLGYCFEWVGATDTPSVRLDDGTALTGYHAMEAFKDLYGNQLIRPHPTQRELYCLTELGQEWARDIIERGQA